MKRLSYTCATAMVAGTLVLSASAAFADQTWTPPPPDSYPSGWNVRATPGPQAYDYKVGTGTMELGPTGKMPPPQTQNAQVIYQMVPGGLRYHRITQ